MMEKYLRLLNPKTTNYESTGGGSFGSLTTQDICLALSYARFTAVQSHLVRLYALNQNSIDEIKLSTKIIHKELALKKQIELTEDYEISLFIALVELCKVPVNYKPSERNRAVIGGVSRMQIQRHLNRLIDELKKQLKNEIDIVEEKIIYQLNKSTNR